MADLFEFKLPDVGEGLVEGEIVRWRVKEGDSVTEDQPLVDVLTDKAEVEIPSPKTGRVLKLHFGPGQKVKVHETFVTFELGAGAAPPIVRPSGGGLAMPAVRKLAGELRVDLAGVPGTGPGGRVSEDDVRRAAAGREAAPADEERVPFVGIRRRTA